MFANKEQLLYFILHKGTSPILSEQPIRLSHYDFKFMANLQSFIKDKNQITSNQAKLFDYLIIKYRKQLSQHKLDTDQIKQLPWKCEVVESLPKYIHARVSYDEVNNLLTIELPYKKEFISSFAGSFEQNPWNWNRIAKRYEAKVSTYALLIASTELSKFFPVLYQGKIKQIMDEVEALRKISDFWNPTYIKVDNKFMLVPTNSVLDELTKNLVLDDSPKTLYALSTLGITVDKSVHNDHPKLLFCSEFQTTYTVINPDEDMNRVFAWMNELGADAVHIPWNAYDNQINKAVLDASYKYNVPIIPTQQINEHDAGHKQVMKLRFRSNPDVVYETRSTKIIYIKNQKEITID